MSNKDYSNIVVVDVECTCWDDKSHSRDEMEIIEIGASVIIGNKVIEKASFYIKPVINPVLSNFCTKLTGIKQETVASADTFTNAFNKFENWVKEHQTNHGIDTIQTLASWGNFDINIINKLSKRNGYDCFLTDKEHVNVKDYFVEKYSEFKGNKLFEHCLNHTGLKFEGSPHSGADDAYNIARMIVNSEFDFNKQVEPIKHYSKNYKRK